MTLHDFLDATATTPAPVLRRAMVAALAAEPARTPDACHRFYARVARGLGLDPVSRPGGSDGGLKDDESAVSYSSGTWIASSSRYSRRTGTSGSAASAGI